MQENKLSVEPTNNRRSFLGSTAKLSAVAVAMLAGNEAIARTLRSSDVSQDVSILNIALGLEYEAINAYQLGATSGLLQKSTLDVAVLFQSHHKEHRDALMGTIRRLGGNPVSERTLDEYARSLRAETLRTENDVLDLATRLELGATNAYLGVIPSLGNRELAKIAARLAADETMHFTTLTNMLGRPLPAYALSFGA